MLETLTVYRLIDPGSEWRLHRQWFCNSAMAGNTADKTTLRGFLKKIEGLYGKAGRVWVMDRGIPTEEVLAEMRASDPPVSYLVGTPKGRLSQYEKALLERPWQAVRDGVQVKLLAQEGELYVLAESRDRVNKERSMRRRQLKGLVNLHVSLRAYLRPLAPGLTPRSLLEKFAAMQMLDVHFPTTDGRELVFCRYTQPEKDHKMLLAQLGWELPPQSPPRITQKGELMSE